MRKVVKFAFRKTPGSLFGSLSSSFLVKWNVKKQENIPEVRNIVGELTKQ